MTILEVENLGCTYPGLSHKVLDGVSFTARNGDLILVSGATGSGKTTLGLVLCGAIPHFLPGFTEGTIQIAGKWLNPQSVRERARTIAFLMQNVERQIFTDRVEDEIAFGLENFAFPAQEISDKIDQALAMTRAQRLRYRLMPTLSSGERQRVMLAALLCLDQPLLILDEPLAYLDRPTARSLLALLQNIAHQGRTILVFEHRRDLVLPIARRELRLNGGRLTTNDDVTKAFTKIDASGPVGVSRLVYEGVTVRRAPNAEILLRDVSFEVRAGQSVVLLGENGSGKTTLLRLALGLLRPSAGTVHACGQKVAASTPRELARRVALVLQNPDHQLHLPTVREEVIGPDGDPSAAERELDALGLRGLEHRHPQSLSMGQKRRLTLASALARKPDLLLLDEPTVGQDDATLELILRRLAQFIGEGGALLTATHDRRAACALAHRVVVLNNRTAVLGGAELVTNFFD